MPLPLTSAYDRYARTDPTNAMQPPNPWQAQPQPAGTQTTPMVPPLPGDPVGMPGYYPGRPAQGQVSATNPFQQPMPQQPNAMAPQYGGAGGLRVNPSYLPEQWDYHQSPEYQQRLAWAQRDLNRQLLSMGRSDSTGGINAMARQQAEIAGQEIDKQYQRALQANMANYGRYIGANTENYGRIRGEDQTGWDRAAYLDQTGFNRQNLMGEQDWNRNFQLANMGYGATQTGVASGAAAGSNLANLLSSNGANQASLALARGDVSADQIQRLLSSGFGFADLERLFANRAPSGAALGGVPGAVQPTLPAYSGAGIGNPMSGSYQGAAYSGGGATPGFDFFA